MDDETLKNEAGAPNVSNEGAQIAGDVTTGGGDFIGRDQIVHGDQVGRDVYHAQRVVIHQYSTIPAPGVDSTLVSEEPTPGESPYKGLAFFDISDARIFFGREQLTAELVAYLRHHPFLAVVGASGSGKSSVVHAGLVPALQRSKPLIDGTLPPTGSNRWPVHIMTPKAHPLEQLAATLTQSSESVRAQATLIDDLTKELRSLHLYATRLLNTAASDRLLLVVDQFEELFTLCRDPQERQAFVDNLMTAAVDDGVTTVIITLRADFYHRCADFANLRLALQKHQKYMGPMSKEELRRAIEEPARVGDWELEPGLVDLLVHDVAAQPGALPLLSHALLETWKRRRGRTLTLTGYTVSGRVQGAIAQTAETVLNQQLTAEQRLIARNIFVRLASLGEGVQDTRRRVALAELMPKGERANAVAKVLQALADARLITTDQDPISGQEEVEVAHEALIREWPTLREWLADNREGLRTHRRLTGAAQEWLRLNRDVDALYRGLRFEQTRAWAQDHADELNLLEQEFLDASQALVDAERREEARKLAQLQGERLLREAKEQKAAGDVAGAIAKFRAAAKVDPDLGLDLPQEEADVRRHIATLLVREGEELAARGEYQMAAVKFKQAQELNPPLDTPLYVWVPPGAFIMGSDERDSLARDNEKPQHSISVDGFWIMRSPVTNAQFKRCVEAGVCTPPDNARWNKAQFANQPVTDVTWHQANEYAHWVGGRLPTEAEWEKAARGTDGRIYPWGDEEPTPERTNTVNSGLGTWTDVGSYPAGASPYGVLDMAGNVWEWTSSLYQGYPYQADDGREDLSSDGILMLRGGSFYDSDFDADVRCAARFGEDPPPSDDDLGFRVVSLGF